MDKQITVLVQQTCAHLSLERGWNNNNKQVPLDGYIGYSRRAGPGVLRLLRRLFPDEHE